MPFPKETANDPKKIGKVKIDAINNADGTGFKVVASFQLLRQNDTPLKLIPVDITTELTAAQVTAITNLLNNLRTRAIAEILP